MAEFTKTEKTTITRLPKRGAYDKETVYRILDEALFCTPIPDPALKAGIDKPLHL